MHFAVTKCFFSPLQPEAFLGFGLAPYSLLSTLHFDSISAHTEIALDIPIRNFRTRLLPFIRHIVYV